MSTDSIRISSCSVVEFTANCAVSLQKLLSFPQSAEFSPALPPTYAQRRCCRLTACNDHYNHHVGYYDNSVTILVPSGNQHRQSLVASEQRFSVFRSSVRF